jgi:isoleucyl-tRNA synthetase
MSQARLVVNLALAERTAKSIKVKQPLASLKVKNTKSKIKGEDDFLELIKDEVNVKEIIFDAKIEKEVELDTEITEELRQEGLLREIVRSVQAQRKEQNLVPQDKISVELFVAKEEKPIIERNKDFLLKEFRATSIIIEDKKQEQSETYSIKIKKA